MALASSEMDTAKPFERLLSSFWAEIKPYFTLRLKDYPTPSYAHRHFGQLWLDFGDIGGYFPVPGTLK